MHVGVAGFVFGRSVLESLAGDEFVISWAWQLSLEWGEHEEELAACCCRLLVDAVDGGEVFADAIAPFILNSFQPRNGLIFGGESVEDFGDRKRKVLAGVAAIAPYL